MLAAAQRLRRREDFAATIRNGRRASRGALVVHLLQATVPEPTGPQPTIEPAHTDQQSARAGFVVSKAVGNAVVRGTVKRRLRHLVRSRLAELPDGAVLVVRALPEAASRGYTHLGEDLDAALAAAGRSRQPRTPGVRR